MKWKSLSAVVALACLSSSPAIAETLLFEFDIAVNNCSGACSSFQPYHFTQTWTLNNYQASAPVYYDFGNNNGMLKAEQIAFLPGAVTVSPSPAPSILAAAGISPQDITPSVYFESAAYQNSGVLSNNTGGDLQFRNNVTLLLPNGDGSYEYKMYHEALFFAFQYSGLPVPMTTDVLEAYLSGKSVPWQSSGSWSHLYDCCSGAGVQISYATLSGEASFVALTSGVSGVPELSTWGMMILGFGCIGFAACRRRTSLLTYRAPA